MLFRLLGRKSGVSCSIAAIGSALVGASVGAVYAVVLAGGSGFVVWVAPGAALVGLLSGVASFVAGALTYRALRRFGRRTISRIGAVCVAAATTGVLVFSVLTMTKSIYTTGTAFGALLFAGVMAAAAVIPLERSTEDTP